MRLRETFPCLSRRSTDSSDALPAAADAARGTPSPSARIPTPRLGGSQPPREVQGATRQAGDALWSCCRSALVSHQQSLGSPHHPASSARVSQSCLRAAGWRHPPGAVSHIFCAAEPQQGSICHGSLLNKPCRAQNSQVQHCTPCLNKQQQNSFA